MNYQITTVSTKGQFVIPSEMRSALGIKPGTRIAVRCQGSTITLQPVTPDLVDKLRGMLKGGGSLSDELIRQRRQDRDRW
jgi:AbrB family looped-hinge helix DNA binding protein